MKCKNCGTDGSTWIVSTRISTGAIGIPDGRFKMNDIVPIAFLACNYCSETLKVIESEEIEAILNRSKTVE